MSVTARLYRRGKWKQQEDGSESAVDMWEIVTTSETETITNILAATGLPVKGDSHPEKTSAILVEPDLEQSEEVLTLWYYTARYSTRLQTREYGEYDTQRTKGGMKSAFKMVPAFYDARGYPLVNKADDLYEGLTKKRRLRKIPVTHNFDTIPNWFFNLSDTINNAAITIHGETYPAGCALLTDIDMPNEPSRDKAGNLYWPVTYNVEIDPDGYFIILPNKGPHEYVFQTRADTSSAWADASKTAYDAETDPTLKQKIKRRIQTVENQDLAQDIWLDANGQAVRVQSLTETAIGTATVTAGSTGITLTAGSFVSATHTGALVKIAGAGPKGRWFISKIQSVTNSTTAVLASAPATSVTSGSIFMSGAIVNYFVMEDLADWSSVPLPNNHPGA